MSNFGFYQMGISVPALKTVVLFLFSIQIDHVLFSEKVYTATHHTVDGRNPAPLVMPETLFLWG